MRVLICGSPVYNDKLRLERILRGLDVEDDHVVTMGRPGHGTDELVFKTCDKLGLCISEEVTEPHWDCNNLNDDQLIPYRNEAFLKKNYDGLMYCKAELVIACCGDIQSCEESKDMYWRCKARGIRFVSSVYGW